MSKVSLRQLAVLTVTGLLAPTVDWLPGMVARYGGGAGWLAPVVALPLLLGWLWVVMDLLRAPGQDLITVVHRGLGRVGGAVALTLYIVWTTAVLAAQLGRSARRLGEVYGLGAGRCLAVLAAGLALWLVWRGTGALCRAGEMFWLALGVVALGLIALAAPQVEPELLVPRGGGWLGGVIAAPAVLAAFAPAILATTLVGSAPREKGEGRRLAGWMALLCGLATLLIGAVMGQMGPRLAGRLAQPFLVMVQGLSLQGALARLEALGAALWLLADFAYAGLLLAVLGKLAGERKGRKVPAAAGALAALTGWWGGWMILAPVGGLVLGIGLPLVLWLLCKTARGGK